MSWGSRVEGTSETDAALVVVTSSCGVISGRWEPVVDVGSELSAPPGRAEAQVEEPVARRVPEAVGREAEGRRDEPAAAPEDAQGREVGSELSAPPGCSTAEVEADVEVAVVADSGVWDAPVPSTEGVEAGVWVGSEPTA